ncbi:MAG: hypothetical protein Q7K65_04210 [Candidatus Buchananbacteria bacterium]|nr:hypothetical protein [Candidatus Buchananbacteria bacterium]
MNSKVWWLILFFVMLFVILFCGCSTTSSPFGLYSGLGIGGGKMATYADPRLKVDPSQVAYKSSDGYAAALALGDISDPEARADAKDAMIAISDNSSIWNRGSRNFGATRGVSDQAPALAGFDGGFGRIYNPFEYPVTVLIRGLGSPYTFGPGEEQELAVPYGRYDVVVYNAETGQLIGHERLDTSRRMKTGDHVYDFNIRLDGTDIH